MASTQSYCTGEQCSLPSCLPACQPANHRYGNLYHQRQCFHPQGGWDAWPVAAVALLHAPLQLFRQPWPFGWWRCLHATWRVRPLTSCSCTATCGPPSRPLSQKPRTLVIFDDIQANQCLVHAQIPSLWCAHHPSSQERLRQRPQRQDHQPECHFHHHVQEPQSYVSDLPLGQAGVPKWQWPPKSCLPWCYDHKSPLLHGDWLSPGNLWEISPAQHPVLWWGLSWGTCLWTHLQALNRKVDLQCGI